MLRPYTRAQAGLAPLNDTIPFSLSVSNHDIAAVCKGGSTCVGRDAHIAAAVRDAAVFSISTSTGGYGDTSPTCLFDSLIKVYPNIRSVVSDDAGDRHRWAW